MRRPAAILLAVLLTLACLGQASLAQSPQSPSLVLLTLDTTRSDYLGAYGAAGARTPVLDALAARGVRFARAVAPSPLTLPSHASLLTGLDPPAHGVRDNGTVALPEGVPTLATVLSARGYTTGAFVASRVLDRRFGLGRGFDIYDDRMSAERLGQYGYPERDAAAVTTAAIDWLSGLPEGKPYFLWVHYYDPHAPYSPPAPWRGATATSATATSATATSAYADEIAYMDHEIGRLLAALPAGAPLVAAVGDHGEMLGEHGEPGHGIFLYRAALEVPLIIAGPRVPVGRVIGGTVVARYLGATLLHLLGAHEETRTWGGRLSFSSTPVPKPIYSEARMPASAYGWAPLKSITVDRWRLVVAPRPELYDFVADPGEQRNRYADRRDEVRSLEAVLEVQERRFKRHEAQKVPVDSKLEADLRSLGYLSATGREGTIDPKDGIELLADFGEAKRLIGAGRPKKALPLLEKLIEGNPGNVPFLTTLGGARLASGRGEAALEAFRKAVSLNSRLDFLHRHLADAYRHLGQLEEARREYELTLQLNPREATVWLSLAEMAHQAGRAEEERELLGKAVATGTASARIRTRLGQLDTAAGRLDEADVHLRKATVLAPEWTLPWFLWGKVAEAQKKTGDAVERYRRVVALAPQSAEGHEARRRLESL